MELSTINNQTAPHYTAINDNEKICTLVRVRAQVRQVWCETSRDSLETNEMIADNEKRYHTLYEGHLESNAHSSI